MDAILHGQRFVDGFVLQLRRNEKAHQIRNHQRDDHRIVLRHLEDHQHRGHGSAHHACENCAHSDQRIRAWRRGVGGKKMMRHGSNAASQHGADKQGRAEYSARIARGVTGGNGDKFQNHQQSHQAERHPAV